MVPTVVFSHPTMAVMGLTEAEAIAKYGADEVTCHKSTWVNMMYSREFLVQDGHGPKPPRTRAKIVCVGKEQRVIGLHMVGLAVDEILQACSRLLLPCCLVCLLPRACSHQRSHSPPPLSSHSPASTPPPRFHRASASPSRWAPPKPTSTRSSPCTPPPPRSW